MESEDTLSEEYKSRYRFNDTLFTIMYNISLRSAGFMPPWFNNFIKKSFTGPHFYPTWIVFGKYLSKTEPSWARISGLLIGHVTRDVLAYLQSGQHAQQYPPPSCCSTWPQDLPPPPPCKLVEDKMETVWQELWRTGGGRLALIGVKIFVYYRYSFLCITHHFGTGIS